MYHNLTVAVHLVILSGWLQVFWEGCQFDWRALKLLIWIPFKMLEEEFVNCMYLYHVLWLCNVNQHNSLVLDMEVRMFEWKNIIFYFYVKPCIRANGLSLWVVTLLSVVRFSIFGHVWPSAVVLLHVMDVGRSQWPHGLKCGSAAASLVGLWVWIPLGGMDACLLWVLCVVR
jgi:hypothetical protein